ncbi:hypothetical protein C8Q76DRAFT_792139 [Earliella scabrosa]|nr:hypothetical protein C8Q76DRAFT_792139 [Earliella scabrosa]
MGKSKKSVSKKKRTSGGNRRRTRKPNSNDLVNNQLCRQGSGSFDLIPDFLDDVKKGMRSRGVDPTNRTDTAVTVQALLFVDDNKFDLRPSEDPDQIRLKPTRQFAEIGKAARRAFPQGARIVEISNYMDNLAGRTPNKTKKVILLDLGRKNKALREKDEEIERLRAQLAGAERVSPVPEVPEEDENMFMDVDVGLDNSDLQEGWQENENTFVDSEVDMEGEEAPSPGSSALFPRTPQRAAKIAQAYLTPPDTTSPLSRQASQARFDQYEKQDQQIAQMRARLGPSTDAEVRAEVEQELRVGHEEETAQLRTRLEQERTRADQGQEQAQEWKEVAEVEYLLRVDAEGRLEEAEGRNVRLEEDRDMYQRKHCGAEAALKGCKMQGARHAVELQRGMQEDMARRFVQYGQSW